MINIEVTSRTELPPIISIDCLQSLHLIDMVSANHPKFDWNFLIIETYCYIMSDNDFEIGNDVSFPSSDGSIAL